MTANCTTDVHDRLSDVQQNRAFYDRFAPEYDRHRFRTRYWRQVARREEDFVLRTVRGRHSVLELGCGTGRFTVGLLGACKTVTVVDASSSMLATTRSRVPDPERLRLVQGDAAHVAKIFGGARFDAVVSMRMLPHLQDKGTVLQAIRDVLRPGGVAVFDLWNSRSFIGATRRVFGRKAVVPTYFVRYPAMRRLIADAGFAVVESRSWGYPRLGSMSLDPFDFALPAQWAYSVMFACR